MSNEKTVAELSMEHGTHQNMINKWKAQLKDEAADIFAASTKKKEAAKERELHELHAKIEGFNHIMFLCVAGARSLTNALVAKWPTMRLRKF